METLKEDLERITGERAIDSGENMSAVLARLDARACASELPDRLRHYLSKRSYVKALAWMEDPSLPHQA